MNRILLTPKGFVFGNEVTKDRIQKACEDTLQTVEKIIRELTGISGGSVKATQSLIGDALGFVFKLPSFLPPYLQISKSGAEPELHISNGPHLFAVYVFSRYLKGSGKSSVIDLLNGRPNGSYFYPFFSISSDLQDLNRLVSCYETFSSIGAGKEIWLNTVSVADVAPYAALINWMIHTDDPYTARVATYLAFMQRSGCDVSQAIGSVKDDEVKRLLLKALAFSEKIDLLAPLSYLIEAFEDAKIEDHELSADIEGSYERYRRSVRKIMNERRPVLPEKLKAVILYVNFAGVEPYLSSFWRLKDYAASSAIVDIMVSSVVFSALDMLFEGYLPHESLVIQHGGHSDVLLPAVKPPEEIKAYLQSSLKDLWDSFRASIEISAGYYINAGALRFDHSALVSESKFSRLNSFKPKIYSYGLHRACENCGLYPATAYSEKDGEYLCETCYRVRRFSEYYSIGKKIRSSFLLPFASSMPLNPEKIYEEDPMEYIGNGGYVTVVKFDGNDMGEYFRSEELLSYASKSYFLYWNVMKAYSETVKQISEACSAGMAHRAVSGTIYLAGDEGVIVLPPEVAPVFIVNFAENVKHVNLKIGALTVKAEHPFSISVEVSEKIMEDAKVKHGSGSTIGYMISEGGITPESYSSTFGGSGQQAPESTGPYEFMYTPRVYTSAMKQLLDIIGYKCSADEDYKNYIRKLSNRLEKIIDGASQEFVKVGAPEAAIVYAYREALRGSDKNILQMLNEAVKGYFQASESRKLNLLWYLFVIKSLRRGLMA